jgi:hypothetical protein
MFQHAHASSHHFNSRSGPVLFFVFNRIYSWMNSGNVEDKYEISKFLPEKLICSQAVLDVVGDYCVLVPLCTSSMPLL